MAGDNVEKGHGGEERDRAQAEKEIRHHLGQLHDKGVVDLDAPVSNLIDVIQREYPADRAGTTAARAGGYWLVGDQGWCDHLT
jgi:hypothetical protein